MKPSTSFSIDAETDTFTTNFWPNKPKVAQIKLPSTVNTGFGKPRTASVFNQGKI